MSRDRAWISPTEPEDIDETVNDGTIPADVEALEGYVEPSVEKSRSESPPVIGTSGAGTPRVSVFHWGMNGGRD